MFLPFIWLCSFIWFVFLIAAGMDDTPTLRYLGYSATAIIVLLLAL